MKKNNGVRTKEKKKCERKRIRSLTKYSETSKKRPKEIHRTNFPYYLTSNTQCNRFEHLLHTYNNTSWLFFCICCAMRSIHSALIYVFFFHIARLPFRYLILLLFDRTLERGVYANLMPVPFFYSSLLARTLCGIGSQKKVILLFLIGFSPPIRF